MMNVYYSGNFWGHTSYERACDITTLNALFPYGGYDWFIPNIYTCSKGMVIDLCRKIPAELYETFYQKWSEIDRSTLTNEQISDIENENPMSLSISFKVIVNGHESHSHGWSAVGWQPCSLDHNGSEAETLMNAYCLDRKDAWYIYRLRVAWPRKKRQEIKSLSLKLSTNKESHSCNRHFTSKPDCEPFDVNFNHPMSGESYQLHVFSCLQNKLPDKFLSEELKEYPKHLCYLQYNIAPALPSDHIVMVQDCANSDRPIVKTGNVGSVSNGVCAIGIIGGADGPSACFISTSEMDKVKIRNSCSSLHFEPVQAVEWFISIQITPCEPKEIILL
jgi:hypothetical protein